MQVEGDWKVAANLHLLLGTEHPPTRLEKPLLTPQQRAAGEASFVAVDARNTANFRSSSYCGLQEKSTPTVRSNVVAYYKDMLRRVPLWRGAVKKKEEGSASDAQSVVVKPEPPSAEEAERGGSDVVVDANDSTPAHSTSTVSSPLFRALGILTQVQDVSTASTVTQQAPWEFYVVRDVDDEDCYARALQAMTQQPSAASAFMLLQEKNVGMNGRASGGGGRLGSSSSSRPSTGGMGSVSAAGEETASTKAEADEEAAVQDGTRLSLYTRQVRQFTGLFPGMAVGVIGEPFQRSARGVLTGVLVHYFVLPERPTLPWRVDRPLPPATLQMMIDDNASVRGARLHFCSGPFPRRDVAGLLRCVTQQALHRGADILIIGGPFIQPFTNEFERGLLPSLGATFNEVMESFVDTLEDTLKNYYATRPLLPHLKVLLVSHKGDVMQIPVLPTTMYAIADTDDILVRSNPCRLSVNGVHVSVCNEDVVGAMREQMVERWPTAEGSLRRVVEALVDGRLYTPLYRFPVTTVDMKHLPQLRMDYVPPRNELLDIEASPANTTTTSVAPSSGVTKKSSREDDEHGGVASTSRSWDAVLQLASSCPTTPKIEVKRAKAEPVDDDNNYDASAGPSGRSNPADATKESSGGGTLAASSPTSASVEFLPHIMFLPSTRPQFAVVTHQHEEVDGDDVDNTARASGVLVVNQEVWSTRSSPKFQLRVAEVTIPNTELVLRRGANAASGVACGVLHIYAA
jgi:DNA polymerase alpha subunit B